MAVIGVFAVAEIRDHEQLGDVALERADRALDDARGIVRGAGHRIFAVGDAEEQNGTDAECPKRAAFNDGFGHAVAPNAGHARDLAGGLAVVGDEQRLYEAPDADVAFAHELAHRGARA